MVPVFDSSVNGKAINLTINGQRPVNKSNLWRQHRPTSRQCNDLFDIRPTHAVTLYQSRQRRGIRLNNDSRVGSSQDERIGDRPGVGNNPWTGAPCQYSGAPHQHGTPY